ncbi:MAG: hypothetical protein ACOZDY_03165 [Pseudomonadota bacterium]
MKRFAFAVLILLSACATTPGGMKGPSGEEAASAFKDKPGQMRTLPYGNLHVP